MAGWHKNIQSAIRYHINNVDVCNLLLHTSQNKLSNN